MTTNKLKVLLINPICAASISEFIGTIKGTKINADEPLGLCYLSSFIKKELPDIEIEIYDHHIESLGFFYHHNGAEEEELNGLLVKKIQSFKPQILGISCPYYLNSKIIHENCKLGKEIDHKMLVILGGIYPTASPNDVLSDSNVDYIIPGEAELAFRDFLQFYKNEKKIDDLLSIGYLKKDTNEIVFRCKAPIIEDLNSLSWPDRSTLPIGKYAKWGRTLVERFYKPDAVVAALQSSRGCPFACTFCSGHVITRRRYRKRNISDIINEMKMLKEKYQIDTFVFNEENANVDTKWTTELYKEISRSGLNIRWVHGGGFYVQLMNAELIEYALKSGIIMFNIAIESGSKRILNLVKKSEKIVDSAPIIMDKIRQKGPNMYVTGFFMAGFPFETETDIIDTINFAKSLDFDWVLFNLFQPFPGCELYDYCIKNNHLDSFDTTNLRNYIASKLKNTIVPIKKVEEMIYLANLEINFVNARTIRKGFYDQAYRDYKHITNIAPDHALAHYCLAKAYKGLNKSEEADKEIAIIKKIINNNPVQRDYLEQFKIDLDKI